jgi:hypothetical protein
MRFSLGAASYASCIGRQHVHALLRHQFDADETGGSLCVTARARQFSSFVLMVGKLAAGDEFAPSHAILVQNKDEIVIPLTTTTIASAKQVFVAISACCCC